MNNNIEILYDSIVDPNDYEKKMNNSQNTVNNKCRSNMTQPADE